ncbi:MAG: SAM-dependent methyltransferase [Chitinophagales bacterium]|jgi:16S rRNA (cytidine1402-2'-O)-methyltransferase|nr:SAM-dependent methyltransferase [Chitinophagales bacterium]
MSQSKVWLIPTPISDTAYSQTTDTRFNINELNFFVVENLREARRNLRKMKYSLDFDKEVEFLEMNFHQKDSENKSIYLQWLQKDVQIGIMSDAGIPAIADPGQKYVAWAHDYQAEVIPLVGANSMMMALAASGLNGQRFTFWGYLPIKEDARNIAFKKALTLSQSSYHTQIFIETPYRNKAFFDYCLKQLPNSAQLCVAIDILGENQRIQTQTIEYWKKMPFAFIKKPCVFLFTLS